MALPGPFKKQQIDKHKQLFPSRTASPIPHCPIHALLKSQELNAAIKQPQTIQTILDPKTRLKSNSPRKPPPATPKLICTSRNPHPFLATNE
jgi:hypothetical protein